MYKIVKVATEDHRVSLYAWGDACIAYERGKTSRAPGWLKQFGYGPTAFTTFSEALEMAMRVQTDDPLEIWECTGEGECLGRERISTLPTFQSLSYLACGIIEPRRELFASHWPMNTVMYEGLTLTEPVLRLEIDAEDDRWLIQRLPRIEIPQSMWEDDEVTIETVDSIGVHNGF